jgi:hypothetical protein
MLQCYDLFLSVDLNCMIVINLLSFFDPNYFIWFDY